MPRYTSSTTHPPRLFTAAQISRTLRGVQFQFSIPGKVFAAFVVLILTFGAVSLFGIAQIRGLGGTVDGIHRTLIPLPSSLAEIKGELRSLDLVFALPDGPALERSVHVARRVDPHLPRIDEMMGQVEALLGGPGTTALAAQVEGLRATQNELEQAATRFFGAVEGEAETAVTRQAARRAASQLGRELVAFEGAVGSAIDNAMGAFREEEQRVVWGAIAWAAVGLVVGVLVTVSASRLLRPLRELRAGVERVAAGRLEEPVEVATGGELADLAREFNRMAEAIRKRDAQLSEQQTALLHRERLATVGRMSAQITHELRNPLSSIGLNSELLMDELHAGAGRDLLESIIREVERLREITEEYLRFARLPRPEPVPVDLNHAAAELLDFVKGEMDQAGVKARLDPDRAARAAYADPNQLRAALLNLLRNAREALSEVEHDGHVVVRVRTLGDAATIEVVDDGPGMSEEAQAHLFEPFFSTKAQGTGLGLSMVRQIVDAQNGTLTVESQPGKGTTVRMTLPLAEE